MCKELNYSIKATERIAQYDQSAKRLLGQKIILAYILVHTVEAFYNMDPKDVVPLIEGEPFIGEVPIEAGLTNKMLEQNGEKIVGLNTEQGEINEGVARFDIVFYVRMKDGLSKMMINVEAQKKEPEEYQILNRAIFYVSRLISSQKERDFEKSNYNDIKQVYSIWVCMNMEGNSLNHFHLTDDKVFGTYQWKGNLDLINIIMIGLSKEIPPKSDENELHRLLGTLLSHTLTSREKSNIIKSEYYIMEEEKMEGAMNQMCNLGEGIWEEGIEKGIEEGVEKGAVEEAVRIILNMHETGFTNEQIVIATKKSLEEIKEIIKANIK